MTENNNPWDRDRNAKPRSRIFVALGVAAVFGALAWLLSTQFPGQIKSDWDYANLLQLIGVLALISSGALFWRRVMSWETFRNLALWAAIAALFMIGFSFQDELQNVFQRIRSEVIPSEPVVVGNNEIVLTAAQDGHFYAMATVNGSRVRFLIDTGASDIVLAPDDAKRVGYDVNSLNFSRTYQTANGVGEGAPIRLEDLRIGPIALSDVPASVNRAPMATSLLGMSFLRSIGSFQIEGRTLTLRSK